MWQNPTCQHDEPIIITPLSTGQGLSAKEEERRRKEYTRRRRTRAAGREGEEEGKGRRKEFEDFSGREGTGRKDGKDERGATQLPQQLPA